VSPKAQVEWFEEPFLIIVIGVEFGLWMACYPPLARTLDLSLAKSWILAKKRPPKRTELDLGTPAEAQHKAGHRYVTSIEAYLIHEMESLSDDVARFHPIG
jgi:hypothetical protein